MKLKTRIILFAIVSIVAFWAVGVVDVTTDNAAANVALNNVNGGDMEYVGMRGANSFKNHLTSIVPVGMLVLGLVTFRKELANLFVKKKEN